MVCERQRQTPPSPITKTGQLRRVDSTKMRYRHSPGGQRAWKIIQKRFRRLNVSVRAAVILQAAASIRRETPMKSELWLSKAQRFANQRCVLQLAGPHPAGPSLCGTGNRLYLFVFDRVSRSIVVPERPCVQLLEGRQDGNDESAHPQLYSFIRLSSCI